MWKYDRAYYGGRGVMTSWERWDINAHRTSGWSDGGGLFDWGRRRVARIPHWAGHCNGWTAASIRHAEPQKNVTKSGVTFTPADIKSLLADLYTYTDIEYLGGVDYVINPAVLHVVITNWIGRQSHPIAMETTPGREVWNFPAYSFATAATKSENGLYVDVKMNVAYKMYTEQEHNKAPKNQKQMYFHYGLNLNKDGKIIGGYYYDSSQIDMLWLPLKPTQGGKRGNEAGCPHLSTKELLSIWRESVPEELRVRWVNIDAEDKPATASKKPKREGASADSSDSASTTDPAASFASESEAVARDP